MQVKEKWDSGTNWTTNKKNIDSLPLKPVSLLSVQLREIVLPDRIKEQIEKVQIAKQEDSKSNKWSWEKAKQEAEKQKQQLQGEASKNDRSRSNSKSKCNGFAKVSLTQLIQVKTNWGVQRKI